MLITYRMIDVLMAVIQNVLLEQADIIVVKVIVIEDAIKILDKTTFSLFTSPTMLCLWLCFNHLEK